MTARLDRARRTLSSLRTALTPGVDQPGPRRLGVRNRLSVRRVRGGDGPTVSLTSYGDRLKTVHLAIESIARGTLRPGRLILWLDRPDALRELPAPLRRLRRRGLEIRLCENFGPHTKYFPFVESEPEFTGPLVTADDDVIYPVGWLDRLAAEHARTPHEVVAYRARRMSVTADGALAPYGHWQLVDVSEASTLNFVTGVSGAIHPVALLEAVKARGREFLDCCPHADDVWLSKLALESQIPIRVIDGVSVDFPLIEGTQDNALWYVNWLEGRNDLQIAQTYTESDVAALVAAASRAGD